MPNNKIKIFAIGAEGFTNQIDRIREGIKTTETLELVDNHKDAAIIYYNNPDYANIAEFKRAGKKIICNVLDIPWHLYYANQFDFQKLADQLQYADAITTISKTVASDLNGFGIFDVSVIYNPIKDVNRTGLKKEDFKYLYVGRANDPNKRFWIVRDLFREMGWNPDDLAVCGSENPNFGMYLGVVSDERLNDLYNSVDYVFLPSWIEGIGLSSVEGAICGAIPILCNDNMTAKEIFSPYWDAFYTHLEPNPKIIASRLGALENQIDLKKQMRKSFIDYGEFLKSRYDKKSVAQNIEKIAQKLIL